MIREIEMEDMKESESHLPESQFCKELSGETGTKGPELRVEVSLKDWA